MTIKANRNIQLAFFTVLFLSCLVLAVWLEKYYIAAIPFGILLFFAGWKSIRLIVVVLLFTLPFSTEWQINPELGTDLPDELFMLLAAGLFLCYCVYSPKVLTTLRHPLILLLGITFIWALVTILSSNYPIISLKFILAKGWYIGAFVLAPLIVFRTNDNIRIAIMSLALTMLVVVIICLVRHAQYGFSFARINDALHPFFRNHVNYSAMLVCIIPVFFAFYRLASSGSTRKFTIFAIIILLIALFLSYARGAWLAFLIGVASYWLVNRKLLLTVYIATIILAAGSLTWLINGQRYLQYANNYRETIFHPDFQEHLQATYQLKDLSTAERFYRWIAGGRMVNDQPITGFGPGTFYKNYKPYAIPAFKTWVSGNKEHSTVHNYFLLLAVEQGIPGLVFFLFLVGAMIWYAQRIYHRASDPFYKTIASTTAVVLMMILTVNSLSDLIETDKIGSLFFLCIALLVTIDIKTGNQVSDSSPDIERIP